MVKAKMKKAHAKRGVLLFCDLHGHSMKKNAFFYGCNKTTDTASTAAWAASRLLSRVLAKKSPYFSLQSCRFRVTEDKKGTARVVAWAELGIPQSFTLETSFFG